MNGSLGGLQKLLNFVGPIKGCGPCDRNPLKFGVKNLATARVTFEQQLKGITCPFPDRCGAPQPLLFLGNAKD